MPTALDVITDALQLLGVYDPGVPLTDADAQRGLTTLNDMLDSWDNESLTTFQITEQSGTLVPGQASYTIGPGGNFNVTRPIRLITGPGAAYVQDPNGNNYLVDVVDRARWNMIGNRSSLVTSNFPDTLFYDPQFPLGVINLNPYPNIAYTLFWDSYLQLSDFGNLQTSVSLPPGYKLAMSTNLAIFLKPYFSDGQLDPTLVAQAQGSKANIKRSNIRLQPAVYDSEIVSRGQVSYNPYTDRTGTSAS